MHLSRLVRHIVFGVALVVAAAPPVAAQEISPAHLEAALEAVNSAGASRGFDLVLPAVAEGVQNQLIRTRPDLHKEILDAVDAVALTLVVRRQDLNNDVARIWAKAFTIEELQSIAAFYKSPAGQKFAQVGPQVIQEAYQAVQNWSQRVTEEMLAKAREELKKRGVDF